MRRSVGKHHSRKSTKPRITRKKKKRQKKNADESRGAGVDRAIEESKIPPNLSYITTVENERAPFAEEIHTGECCRRYKKYIKPTFRRHRGTAVILLEVERQEANLGKKLTGGHHNGECECSDRGGEKC